MPSNLKRQLPKHCQLLPKYHQILPLSVNRYWPQTSPDIVLNHHHILPKHYQMLPINIINYFPQQSPDIAQASPNIAPKHHQILPKDHKTLPQTSSDIDLNHHKNFSNIAKYCSQSNTKYFPKQHLTFS